MSGATRCWRPVGLASFDYLRHVPELVHCRAFHARRLGDGCYERHELFAAECVGAEELSVLASIEHFCESFDVVVVPVRRDDQSHSFGDVDSEFFEVRHRGRPTIPGLLAGIDDYPAAVAQMNDDRLSDARPERRDFDLT
jgi:hypothetical protein